VRLGKGSQGDLEIVMGLSVREKKPDLWQQEEAGGGTVQKLVFVSWRGQLRE